MHFPKFLGCRLNQTVFSRPAAFPHEVTAHEYSSVAICFLKGQTYYFIFKFTVMNSNFPGPKVMKWG